MTPKEKAKELFEQFNYHVEKKNFFGDDVEQRNTKQCALIAVNETINALEIHQWQNKSVIEYYLEVKQEIEKL